jgi:hypothetical protein
MPVRVAPRDIDLKAVTLAAEGKSGGAAQSLRKRSG